MTQLFSLTDTAVLKIKNMLADQKDKMGLKIGLNTRGCAGLSYTMDYATSDNINECEKLENYEVPLFIDNKAVMYIIGTQMDFVKEEFGERFVFNNPNQTSECGCGESFHVES